MVIEAKYENGVFKPLGKIKLKEGTVVEIHVNRQASGESRNHMVQYRRTGPDERLKESLRLIDIPITTWGILGI